MKQGEAELLSIDGHEVRIVLDSKQRDGFGRQRFAEIDWRFRFVPQRMEIARQLRLGIERQRRIGLAAGGQEDHRCGDGRECGFDELVPRALRLAREGGQVQSVLFYRAVRFDAV